MEKKKRLFNNVKNHKENANTKLDKTSFFVLLGGFLGLLAAGMANPPAGFNFLAYIGIVGSGFHALFDGIILFDSDFSHKSIFSKALSYTVLAIADLISAPAIMQHNKKVEIERIKKQKRESGDGYFEIKTIASVLESIDERRAAQISENANIKEDKKTFAPADDKDNTHVM